jgi:transcriptional regulator with XRE-family HTH domain
MNVGDAHRFHLIEHREADSFDYSHGTFTPVWCTTVAEYVRVCQFILNIESLVYCSEGIAMVGDTIDSRVGKKIREIRTQRRMSLTHLAEQTGVSKSLVSQVERGMSNPSLPVLRSLAQALDVPLFTLFVDDDLRDGLVRREDRQQLRIPGSNIVRELLVPDLHRQMLLVAAHFNAGDASSFEGTSHRGEECVLVTSGSIGIEVGSTRIILNTGDSYYFDSELSHVIYNPTDEPAEIIAAISPAVRSRSS